MRAIKTITTPELKVGDIAHFHGARFEIYSTKLHPEKGPEAHGPIMVAMGRWIDGEVVPGYFGPTKDWNFQGNKLARVRVEINE